MPKWLNQEKRSTFAKNTAHTERFLLNNSYLCGVVRKKSAMRHIEEAFSAVPSVESGQFTVCWNR